MSQDKRKLHTRAMSLIASRPTGMGMPLNRRYFPQYHRRSDNPEITYLIERGYATIERQSRGSRSFLTYLQPTSKWLDTLPPGTPI